MVVSPCRPAFAVPVRSATTLPSFTLRFYRRCERDRAVASVRARKIEHITYDAGEVLGVAGVERTRHAQVSDIGGQDDLGGIVTIEGGDRIRKPRPLKRQHAPGPAELAGIGALHHRLGP